MLGDAQLESLNATYDAATYEVRDSFTLSGDNFLNNDCF